MVYTGAQTNIRNNEKQIPYDLSAKNPEVGRLLMVRGRWTVVCVCECVCGGVWVGGCECVCVCVSLTCVPLAGRMCSESEYFGGRYITAAELFWRSSVIIVAYKESKMQPSIIIGLAFL